VTHPLDYNPEAIRAGHVSVRSRLEAYLKQIEQHKSLNAFIHVFAGSALKQADTLDDKIRQGTQTGKLAGMVIAVKDNIAVKDATLTCGSKMLENYISPYAATVIERLLAEDAIIIGKTNLDEFAMGSSNENSYFGAVKNPHDTGRVPGGSSGGSAVAVAAGMCDAALGSDTGGSIRQPASFTGTIGLKPGYGRVSRYGLVAFASSLDQIGVFSRTPSVAAQTLAVIAGADKRDSTCADEDVPDYHARLNPSMKDITLGIPEEYFQDGLDGDIRNGVRSLIDKMREAGARVREIALPMTEYAIAIYYIIATAEASSNLARFDGVRYGFRAEDPGDLNEMYARTRAVGFGEEVRRRIMLGTYVLSAGYYDAYYRKALQVRRKLKEDFDNAFEHCDLIVSPTTPTPAFALGEKADDPLAMYLQDIYTVSANLAGIPAISVPAGTSNGLPYGMQLQAAPFNEQKLLNAAQFIHSLNLT